jgi:hypothetical protein
MNNELYKLLTSKFMFLESHGFAPKLISEKLTEELSMDR